MTPQDRRAPGSGSRARARPPRAPGTSRSPPRSTSRPARRGLHHLAHAQPAPAGPRRSCSSLASTLGLLPLLFRLGPGIADVDVLGVPLPWVLLGRRRLPGDHRPWAGSTCASPSATRTTSATCSTAGEPGARPVSNAASIVAVVLVSLATLAVGAFGLRLSRTTSDFYVASRGVSPVLNASAIGGEYLSAASFLGVAGLVLARGVDMLWLPGRLDRGLPRAARLRRRAAAPVGRLHAARLRPAAPRVRRGAASARACSSSLIGLLYLIPQFQGAGLTLRTAHRGPDVGGRGWPSRSSCCLNVAPRRHAEHHPRAGLPVLAQAAAPC